MLLSGGSVHWPVERYLSSVRVSATTKGQKERGFIKAFLIGECPMSSVSNQQNFKNIDFDSEI